MSEQTFAQRLFRALSSQEVENVKARHTYLHGRTDTATEFSTMWALNKNCSWAHGFGRMRGVDQVWYGSVNQYDQMSMENWLEMHKIYPEVGGKDPRPLMENSVHTLVADVIEVAADGKSARASYFTPGLISSRLTPEQHPYSNILWERYGADFVYEDGKWLYLHEHVCPDIPGLLDSGNWAHDDYVRKTTPQSEEGMAFSTSAPPPVTDPGPLHQDYTCTLPPQNDSAWPVPYETLDQDNTYAYLIED